mmetsp:Transcript_20634/g.45083  ORF Transcript_20634/g.45083 Transcript_20634/m.45083 type:complete len:103 (-) Transcript_20634:381-689(-)|eukprot:CAMPEP_0178569340 /NCGR_PEP_ID=MMETSP0697-20121206/16433_1 /TAXON_ID=265572 /ORGANISM="Extubocellulus spinifer, Strain CCMP396" /LENGTH=102 /DNA_ID=CAMNT_0020203587 /DNA_START=81 /DNA_END=389 /DNA_ORIENTATION=+
MAAAKKKAEEKKPEPEVEKSSGGASSSLKHIALGLHFACLSVAIVLYVGGAKAKYEEVIYRAFLAAASFLFFAIGYPPFGLPSAEDSPLATKGFKAPKIKST